MTVVNVRPGETVTVIGLPSVPVLPPGPVDPGYSPPWAQVPDPNAPRPTHPIMLPGMPGWGVPPGGQGGGPVDPGYSPPWAQVRPPVDPGYSPPWAQVPVDPEHPWVPPPSGPVDPGFSPPWAQVPDAPDGGAGTWVWAWSPAAKRWMWVRVPGQGEAGPK